ncbi:hypothetical protein BC826DRAFT_562600 [Russula brevipes]|nr:hypothetical protein BC826DRAFT_562600 [Russula brevipes]
MYLFVAFRVIILVASFHHRGHLVSDRHVTGGGRSPSQSAQVCSIPVVSLILQKLPSRMQFAATLRHRRISPPGLRGFEEAWRRRSGSQTAMTPHSTTLFLSGCLPRTTLCSSTRLGPE